MQYFQITAFPAWAGEPAGFALADISRGVYPRVGGGAVYGDAAALGGPGLSPRGRGSRYGIKGFRRTNGSIPAWAGEPPERRPAPAGWRVYPRVGGGANLSRAVLATGLSPRGRGSLYMAPGVEGEHGSIPAWAGEPEATEFRLGTRWVYPRVGGGAAIGAIITSALGGLSPRGRGSLVTRHREHLGAGSIPAWAGEPGFNAERIFSPRVYPRVGGGASSNSIVFPYDAGLSPRGRGSLIAVRLSFVGSGSIPAWAGEPAATASRMIVARVYPRVGGGAVPATPITAATAGLSPRGRGSLTPATATHLAAGSIPAWAGEPNSQWDEYERHGVYPRVGGGANEYGSPTFRSWGLSPRGRGSRSVLEPAVALSGSIPAWAGEPASAPPRRSAVWVYPRVGGGAWRARE